MNNNISDTKNRVLNNFSKRNMKYGLLPTVFVEFSHLVALIKNPIETALG